MTISNVIERLEDGNQRFVTDRLDGKLNDDERRISLIEEQNPFAIILSCADSRVVPELIFDVDLGELFVVRVAGNVANISSIASVEYAVTQLNSKVVVVLGHQNCGAVTAAMKGGDNGINLNHLLNHITPALNSCNNEASLEEVVKCNAEKNTDALYNNSSIIKKAVDKGNLKIIPAYYNLDSGLVEYI